MNTAPTLVDPDDLKEPASLDAALTRRHTLGLRIDGLNRTLGDARAKSERHPHLVAAYQAQRDEVVAVKKRLEEERAFLAQWIEEARDTMTPEERLGLGDAAANWQPPTRREPEDLRDFLREGVWLLAALQESGLDLGAAARDYLARAKRFLTQTQPAATETAL